jgi:hypothetical protein
MRNGVSNGFAFTRWLAFGFVFIQFALNAQQYLGTDHFHYQNGRMQPYVFPGSRTVLLPGVINNAGDIASTFGSDCFLLSGGHATSFTVPGATKCSPTGINDSDAVVGWFVGPNGEGGFLRTSTKVTVLNIPDCFSVAAHGINNKGQIVGECEHSGVTSISVSGFLLDTDGSIHSLNAPGASSTFPAGIDDRGHVAVYILTNDASFSSFIYADGSFHKIEDPACPGIEATSMSPGGVIVGQCLRPVSANIVGFILDTRSSHFVTLENGKDDAVLPTGVNDKGAVIGTLIHYAPASGK